MANRKEIDITGTIMISKNINIVYDYFANYFNDPLWRNEINETEIKNYPATINTLIVQDTFLSRKVPHFLVKLICIDLQKNKSITCETNSESKFWQKNTRETEAITDNLTKVTYRIQFDKNLVAYGLGYDLPKFIVNYYTRRIMKKYLNTLKENIE